jgi:hypothetical protein
MTVGFDDEVDPTAGQTEEAVDTSEEEMELEETTEAVVGHMAKNAGSTSLQNEAARSAHTSTTTTTGMHNIEEGDEEEEEEEILGMKNGNWKKQQLIIHCCTGRTRRSTVSKRRR